MIKSLRVSGLAAIAAVMLLGGCAAAQGPGADAAANDPIEGLNRGIFYFNQGVDKAVLRPVGWVYREGVPDVFQDRIRDFLNHLRSPVIFANELFQGEFDRAEITFRRFFINTIAGVGGIIDVANSVGIPPHDEDFGQTLGSYGVAEGPYLMLPFLGPSNPRDTVGIVVDFFLDPVRYVLAAHDGSDLNYVRLGTDVVDRRSRTIRVTDDLERNSVDYYATVRSLYRQRRENLIRNGAPGSESPYPTLSGAPALPGQVSKAE